MNQFQVLPAYKSLFHSDKTYHLISGGRASGKSTQVAVYFIMKMFGEEHFRGVISRYTSKSIKHSIYQDIMDLLTKLNLIGYIKVSGDTIEHKTNGNMILCHSIKLAEGTMTAKSKGLSNVSHLIIDEATELDDEEEYFKLIDSFRYKGERRIFLCFNPTYMGHWIFKRFYLPNQNPNPKWFEDHNFIHTTYLDNIENIDPKKVREWERMKELDPEYYEHHILGLWRKNGEGQILKGWKFEIFNPEADAVRVIGLDFGFYPDPTCVVDVRKKGRRLWIKELLYERNLTNQDVIEHLRELGITRNDLILADKAEPKSIEEIRRGGFNIRGAQKPPDSVRYGLAHLNSLEVSCCNLSKNIIREYNNYSYKTGTNIPEDDNNHSIDAIRYALSEEKARYSIFKKTNETEEFS